MKPKSKILVIAGSDSSGGAGIQADIKTITALGSYAMTAITAVTIQNTTGVKSIVPIDPKEISNQIEFTSKDIKPDAIKIGMLHSTKVIKSATHKNVYKPIRKTIHSMKGGKKTRKQRFLYHPDNPDKSFDVYINKNPKDTIPIQYTTVKDVKQTIKRLEKLYKTGKYTHKRIWQVGMIMKVRLEAMLKHHKTRYPNAKHVKQRYELAKRYFDFLSKRTRVDKKTRKKLTFSTK